MRTTIEFDDDTARAIEKVRRSEGVGVSEAVNELVRRGLLQRASKHRSEQRAHSMGLEIDVSKVAEALDLLDRPDAR